MSSLTHRQRWARDAAQEPKRLPIVFASVSEPSGRRRRCLVLTGVCRYCGGRHVHFVSDIDHAGGARRAGCGRGTYWIAVARIYRVRPVETEAAA